MWNRTTVAAAVDVSVIAANADVANVPSLCSIRASDCVIDIASGLSYLLFVILGFAFMCIFQLFSFYFNYFHFNFY